MNKSVKNAAAVVLSLTLLTTALVQPALAASVATTTTSTQSFKTSKRFSYTAIKEVIAKYKETNKEVTGWLIVPGTNIKKPVTFNGTSNNYYVNRDWQGRTYSPKVWPKYDVTAEYLDYRTVLGDTWKTSSKNTVIYGHNWTNLKAPFAIGSDNNHEMFGQLPSYNDIDFAKENPYIYFSTGKNEGIWKIFSVAYCEVSDNFFYNNPDPNKTDYQTLLNEWKDRTMFDFDTEVTTSDRILTLSTCTRQFAVGDTQRFVVVARLLRDGESDKDPVSVSVNKDMKKPLF